MRTLARQKGQQTVKWQEAMKEARQRGAERGAADKAHNYYNPAPLSGERAGESPQELLGDLIRILAVAILIDATEIVFGELCDSYEEGYSEANDTPGVID